MRAVCRSTLSVPVEPVTATMMRSAVSQTMSGCWVARYASSSSSVSSATKRNESSRSATRFSVRKNPDSAEGTLDSG